MACSTLSESAKAGVESSWKGPGGVNEAGFTRAGRHRSKGNANRAILPSRIL